MSVRSLLPHVFPTPLRGALLHDDRRARRRPGGRRARARPQLDPPFLELNLFIAVFGFPVTRRSALLRAGLVLIVAARLLAFAVEGHPVAAATRPVVLAVALVAVVGALRFALRTQRVDAEHVYAALDAYLLIGVFAGLLHHLIEETLPGSYVYGGAPMADFSLATAIYFSFVTLATLGYGDIVPQTDIARGVTVVEAVVGQLYLAVLVARLVSNATAGREETPP